MRIIEWEKMERKRRKRRKRKKGGTEKERGERKRRTREGKQRKENRKLRKVNLNYCSVTYLFLDRIPIHAYGIFFLFLVLQHVCCLLGLGWGEFR